MKSITGFAGFLGESPHLLGTLPGPASLPDPTLVSPFHPFLRNSLIPGVCPCVAMCEPVYVSYGSKDREGMIITDKITEAVVLFIWILQQRPYNPETVPSSPLLTVSCSVHRQSSPSACGFRECSLDLWVRLRKAQTFRVNLICGSPRPSSPGLGPLHLKQRGGLSPTKDAHWDFCTHKVGLQAEP